ncbi:MAG: efflux RND transporter periplasmic adaptor subunit [Polyangiales bacterium]
MYVAKLLIIVAASGALTSCGERADKLTQLPAAEQKGAAPTAIPVTLAQVARQEVVRSVVATGTTEPARVADLGPQSNGRIGAVMVDEGDRVKAGAMLIRLDADEASLRVQQSTASASQAKAQYELARAEYERLAPLLSRGTVTPQQLQRLEAQRDALKSAVEAAQVAQSDAKRMQTNTTVRAPFAGVISKVSVEVGEVVTMVPPTQLVRLVDLSSVDVRVRVHERELGRIAVGDAIEATFPSSGQTGQGKVTFISPEIDPRTRNAEVLTRVPSPDGALRAGMFAEIRIRPKSSPNSLVIPSSAIAGAGEERYAYVVESDRAKRQKVKVQPIDATSVEVLEGLREGQQIVREGLGRLSDDAHVAIASDTTKPAAPASAAEAPGDGGATP